jgi:hypothetical protein
MARSHSTQHNTTTSVGASTRTAYPSSSLSLPFLHNHLLLHHHLLLLFPLIPLLSLLLIPLLLSFFHHHLLLLLLPLRTGTRAHVRVDFIKTPADLGLPASGALCKLGFTNFPGAHFTLKGTQFSGF